MPLLESALLARLGLSAAASVVFHVALAASLDTLVGGTRAAWKADAGSAPLRARLAPAEPGVTVQAQATPRPATPAPRPAAAAPRSGPGQSAAPGAGSAGLPGTKYFSAAELDARPAPAAIIDPEYPAEALPRRGRLVVRVLINEQGTVDGVQVLSADPPGVFERAATRAFGESRYRPGMKDGRAVKSQFTVEVTFEPDEVPARAAE